MRFKRTAKQMSDEMMPDLIVAAAAGYQHGSGVATFLRCPHQPDMSNADIGLIGFAYSGGNTVERMGYLGPRVAGNGSMAYRRVARVLHLRRKTIEQERFLLRERSAPVNIGAPLRHRRGSHIHTGLFRLPRLLRSLSDRTPLHRLCNKPRYDRRRRR